MICNLMMLTTNPSCNSVLHHLIADTTEVCGGSRKLIRIMNRLGVCVSTDIHDRLVIAIAEKQAEAGIWSQLSRDIFTVVSTDNIDFLRSHAAVYCGQQTRSYHGTTIQAVQPVLSLKVSQKINQSSLEMTDVQESAAANSSTVLAKRSHSPSPSGSDSPHQHGKVGPKRKRTVIPSTHQPLTCTLICVPSEAQSMKKKLKSHSLQNLPMS